MRNVLINDELKRKKNIKKNATMAIDILKLSTLISNIAYFSKKSESMRDRVCGMIQERKK